MGSTFGCIVLVTALSVMQEDQDSSHWPQFRGPGSRGISAEEGLPQHWSTTRNVAWSQPMPGSGWSSPIVFRDLSRHPM